MRTIAYLGPPHTNTHMAALQHFGKRSEYLNAATIEDVFHAVERRHAVFGVVPIENSLEGAVTHTLDRFIEFVDTPAKIYGEIEQPIHHFLITARGVKLHDILLIFSHPQALAQCRRWLQHHLPLAKWKETNSTADAVTYVLQNKAGHAAIGREELAKGYGLRTRSIPNDRENKTRFLIIGLGEPPKSRRNKTSIMFALKDQPGALHDALLPFKRNRINMTKIESRPSKQQAWEYLFFIDVEGHASEPRVQRALRALQRSTSSYQLLGSYPIAR